MNTNLETGWGEQKGTKKMNEANEQHKGFQKKKKKKRTTSQHGINFTRLKLSSHDWLICIAVCTSLKQTEMKGHSVLRHTYKTYIKLDRVLMEH